MRLLFFDTKARNPNRYISRAIFLAIRRDQRVTEAVWASYADAVDLAQNCQFDAFVAFDGEEAANAIVDRLCQLIPRSAIWFTEDPYEYYRNGDVAKKFALIFSNDAETASRYGAAARHLPLAGDKETNYFPVRSDGQRYDLFFAGTAWPNRLEFLKRLKDRCQNLRMKLILVSNGAIAPHIDKYRPDFEFSEGVSIRDFCRIANQSLLTLTIPRAYSTNPLDSTLASDTPGPRLFETALAGSCQLIDTSIMPQGDLLFDSERHFLAYRSVDDCVSKIESGLNDKILAVRIAQAAQQHALDQHLYNHRAEKLVTALLDLVSRAKPAPSRPGRPKILLITHNIVDFGLFGGAEIYLDCIRRLVETSDVSILVPDLSQPTRTKYFLLDAHHARKDEITLSRPVELGDLAHAEFEKEFQRLLCEYGFDIVHINHLMRYPLSLPHIARAYGAKVVFSMHDYYAICENHNLIGLERRYCEIPERPPQTCDPCLLQTRGFDPGSQSRRLRFSRESFDKVDLVLAGSPASSDIFLKMFPQMRGKIEILEPPILPGESATRKAAAPAKSESLHVAWLGNFTTAKGADTAIAVFEILRNRPFVFHIFGRLDDVDDRFKLALEAGANPAVIVHGSYDPGLLPPELKRCEVALFLSTWPETYCMTLSEAQTLGLIPIVTAVGAQSERVAHGRNGFHVPQNEPSAVVSALELLMTSRDLVSTMRAQQPQPSGIMPEQFATRLEAIYARLVKDRTRWTAAEFKQTVALDELGIYLSSTRWITNPPAPPPVEETPPPPPPLHIRAVNFIRNPNRLHRARLAFVRESRKIAQIISGSTKRP